MAVTQDQINQINNDFDNLINDILVAVPPHDPRVQYAIMAAQMAKTAVVAMLTQFLHPHQGQP